MASGDRIGIADKQTLDTVNSKIGNTSDTGGNETNGSVMAKLNATLLEAEQNKNLSHTILTILGSGQAEYTNAGTYSLEIPAGITKLTITACGGGGGSSGYWIGSGAAIFGPAGSGGESIVDQQFTIPSSSTPTVLTIKVGAGGAGGSASNSASALSGKNGGSTVIGNLITLAGGNGGVATTFSTFDTQLETADTPSAGQGSGFGGRSRAKLFKNGSAIGTQTGKNGGNGSTGSGGVASSATDTAQSWTSGYYQMIIGGGGGGGSIGSTPDGSSITDAYGVGKDGVRGSGGTCGCGTISHLDGSSGSNYCRGNKGGTGYVKIIWGV